MTRDIDSRISVEYLKKEAKRWLKLLRAGNADAIARFRRALPDLKAIPSLSLRPVQHALAREHGADGWLALVASVNSRRRALREIADEVLRHAIFRGEHAIAARLYERNPGIAKLDIYTAVAAGDLDEVKRRVAADANAATQAGGPLNWPPLLYLTYMRLPGGATHSIDIARCLLDHGADSNSSWQDDWSNRFTALTGAIGLGEGVKPPHERAGELVDLLVERGADPCDSQSFYNMSIVSDDTHWLDVLWSHSERRGVTSAWREVSKQRIGGNVNLSPLDFMLSLAVSYGHLSRAEWLLTHGADANAKQAYSGRRLREEALVYGNQSMAALLVRYGAAETQMDDQVAFQVACRNLDRAEARRLSELHPEFLRDSEIMLTAARESRIDIVQLLLELGAHVDVENSGGVRALNLAAGFGSVELVKLLIDRGADVDKPTQHYGGPLGFAGHFGRHDTAALLAPLSRDVHNLVFLGMKDRLRELFAEDASLVNLPHARGGMTPLFCLPDDEDAAVDMAQFLIALNADTRVQDSDGHTPADAARKRGLDRAAACIERAAEKG